MKILGLNLFSPHKQNRFDTKRESAQTVPKTLSVQNNLPSSPVSFGRNTIGIVVSGLREDKPLLFLAGLKRILGLPCAYCGKPMLTVEMQGKLADTFAPAQGVELADYLAKAKGYLSGGRAKVADTLAQATVDNPDVPIKDLFKQMAKPLRQKYISKQLKVLDKLQEKYAPFYYNTPEKKTFEEFLAMMRREVYDQFDLAKGGFRPVKLVSYFLRNIPKSGCENMSQNHLHNFEQLLAKIAYPYTEEELFMLKYCGATPNTLFFKLFSKSVSSAEHIKPVNKGGQTEIGNIIATCLGCNHKKQETSLAEFVETNPQIENCIKKQFAFLKKISGKALKPYYSKVSQTLMEESQGKLDLTEFVGK